MDSRCRAAHRAKACTRRGVGLPHLVGREGALRQARVTEADLDFDDAVATDARAHRKRQFAEGELEIIDLQSFRGSDAFCCTSRQNSGPANPDEGVVVRREPPALAIAVDLDQCWEWRSGGPRRFHQCVGLLGRVDCSGVSRSTVKSQPAARSAATLGASAAQCGVEHQRSRRRSRHKVAWVRAGSSEGTDPPSGTR